MDTDSIRTYENTCEFDLLLPLATWNVEVEVLACALLFARPTVMSFDVDSPALVFHGVDKGKQDLCELTTT